MPSLFFYLRVDMPRRSPWKTSILILSAAALLGTGGVFFFNAFPGLLKGPSSGPRDGLSARESALLQDGDLIFRKGLGLPSEVIVTTLGEGNGVSHVGMILHQEGEPWVVHTVAAGLSPSDGVQTQSLKDFNQNSQAQSVVILRLRGAESQEFREALRTSALGWLSRKIPFDNGYNFQDRSKMYCTELLWQILEDADFWTEADRPLWSGPVVGFRTFLNSQVGTIILDHRKH